ncbi:cell envelope integrity protein TolA, partial [Actinobacillus pleuropneumoniae]
AKLKAEKEAKLKAEKDAKAKAEKEAKAKAAAEAKAKADAAAKAAQAKNNKALDDFLSDGDIGGGSSKGGNKNTAGSQGSGNAKGIGDGRGTADTGYAQLIKKKLARTYRVDPSFSGRECQVKIFIDPAGNITNHQVLSGPDDICRAAVTAITSARNVPRAPNEETYNKYKSPIIKFGLKVL